MVRGIAQAVAPTPTDFLVVFSIESWREFLSHGGQVMGFNAGKAGIARRLLPGDRLLCYLSKVSAFVGELEAVGPSYLDERQVWSDGLYPVRLPVRLLTRLDLDKAVPIKRLALQLSFMSQGQKAWSIHVRTSPRRWHPSDAQAVREGLKQGLSARSDSARSAIAPVSPRMVKIINFRDQSRVAKVSRKTRDLMAAEPARPLGSYETVLSFNKVTGYSVNLPIASSCQPTASCLKTCYFATGAPSWSNALRHQMAVEATIKSDPKAFAERVALEYDRLGLSFLRWNGGGDLFPESIDAIHYLATKRPDVVLWVVTRIPELAAEIAHLPNVYVHFSLDRSSMARKEKFLRIKPKTRNFFFSYQAEPEEQVPFSIVEKVSVLFFNNYHPSWTKRQLNHPVVCPLNRAANIAGVCETCRRCFDGAAVGDADQKENHAGCMRTPVETPPQA